MKTLLALVLLISTPAFAQKYVGGGLGTSTISISDCGIQGFTCSTNDTSVSFKVFAGYELNKNVSFEASYVNFGKFSQSASGFSNGTRVDAKADIDGDGFSGDVILTTPVSTKVGLYGRFGFTAWNVTTKAQAQGGGRSLSGSDSASGISPDFGIGIKVSVHPKVDVRGEFQKFLNVGDQDKTGRSDVDLISASVMYRF